MKTILCRPIQHINPLRNYSCIFARRSLLAGFWPILDGEVIHVALTVVIKDQVRMMIIERFSIVGVVRSNSASPRGQFLNAAIFQFLNGTRLCLKLLTEAFHL